MLVLWRIWSFTKRLQNDDDDQPDGSDQKVGHMPNTLVTESDVTSSMMGEMYRQLASAQLRGKLYKTGYRRTKAAPREMQGGVTGQTSVTTAGCGVSTVAMGTPGPLIPGTSQMRTPPRPVRLVTTPRAPVPAQHHSSNYTKFPHTTNSNN